MKTLVTTLLLITLVISNIAKPCFAQQATSSTSTSVAATSVAATSAGTTSATYSLTVVISNVNTRSGKLYVGLANSKATFDGTSFQNKVVDVPASGEISVIFDGLSTGRYAVRVFQDLNNNQKMDFTGQMPAEPFGFSNVAMLMGPPDFDQSAFELTANNSVRIRILEM